MTSVLIVSGTRGGPAVALTVYSQSSIGYNIIGEWVGWSRRLL